MRRLLRALLAALPVLPLAFVAALLWPLRGAPLPEAGNSRVIANVRVVDIARGQASEPTTVTVRNGLITAIGEDAHDAALPVLDGGGRWLLPGFWDMHTHALQLSPQLQFPLMLANGITGTRDMMDCPQATDPLIACVADKRRWTAQAIAGQQVAPRFVQIASFYFEDPSLAPDAAAARARTYSARGVDALKVYNRLRADTYQRLATEAQQLRRPLVGHLPRAVPLEDAMQAGQRSFEHAHLFVRHCFENAAAWRGGALDGEDPTKLAERMVASHQPALCNKAFGLMQASGAAFVPTHVTREEDVRARDPAFADDPRLAYLDPLSRWAWRDDLQATVARYPGPRGETALKAYFEHGLVLTGAAHRAGVPVLVGTDTGLGGFRYHDELQWLRHAGMSRADVLRAATLQAARHLQLQASHGSVEVGKAADLVLLDGDPLQDTANTRRIHAVLLAGHLYDRPRLDALLAYARSQARSPAVMARLLWGFLTSPVSAEL
ncbi:amidohydrolase family protein [Stenotrophomonas sp. GD03908]|uniref:Amidohydrolase family protein n=1 Tax=Stenotrophomonas maltophilia TaxID=40324 RepID=A0AAJ2WLF2_STEMA|nr:MULTISPECIES: amidohydrolase family protein [Stenotrophomonas]MBH1480544.1 amidohydrolase family protein [Stenotrophomonas maltophilia]MDH0980314.1 amidohydrolase family protein [Stenotrophomonas sp. GD03908]MDQ7293313.1 amidohydrolase family protein [Stenotrophomonas sp. Sm0041]MDZ5765103.1 amidohydrolase family protein [Stenotrophomonas maltophilia]